MLFAPAHSYVILGAAAPTISLEGVFVISESHVRVNLSFNLLFRIAAGGYEFGLSPIVGFLLQTLYNQLGLTLTKRSLSDFQSGNGLHLDFVE
ncbi:hypothetical protein SO802_019788 [Lithocarpus litseifolius]|uniref:Uncharacterized protein n=1 Tax=Lithocarpus litseifolius TaxID=425828 RepID=A0AAW2CUN2_9ROSI